MAVEFLFVSLLVAVVTWLAFRAARRRAVQRAEDAWLPDALSGAKLAFAERTFRAAKPFRLVARTDRGYLIGKETVLTELKTRARHRSYLSDVIELSAQKLAVEEDAGFRVSNVGYVLTVSKNGTRAVHPVKLLSRSEMVAINQRRTGILAGDIEPNFARSSALCNHCGHRQRCKPQTYADR